MDSFFIEMEEEKTASTGIDGIREMKKQKLALVRRLLSVKKKIHDDFQLKSSRRGKHLGLRTAYFKIADLLEVESENQ